MFTDAQLQSFAHLWPVPDAPMCTYMYHLLKQHNDNLSSGRSNARYNDAIKIARSMNLAEESEAEIMLILTQLNAYSFVNDEGERVVYMYEWGRDCDLFESDRTYTVPATLEAVRDRLEDIQLNAEGPTYAYLVSRIKGEAFQPSCRDRAAEMHNY